ncbi:MAG: glycosyltransferase [Rikenellaceae bacterium]
MVVSFIVPMYDVAQYIEQCARSLFSQTLESCEFIFVDDCSTDGSAELLMELVTHEFSHLQNRITLVRHASNQGVSETRNTALTIAKGNFVIFIDGDDYVDPELAEELVIEQLLDNSDLVFSNYYNLANGETKESRNPIIGGREGSLQLLASQSFAFANRIWGVLIRRSLIMNNDLRFEPQIVMGEDFLFLTQLLYHSQCIAHVGKPLYIYRTDNDSSATKSISLDKQNSYIEAVKRVEEFLTGCVDGDRYRVVIKLLRLNLRKWLALRRGEGLRPFTIYLRGLLVVVNAIWWLRCALR